MQTNAFGASERGFNKRTYSLSCSLAVCGCIAVAWWLIEWMSGRIGAYKYHAGGQYFRKEVIVMIMPLT